MSLWASLRGLLLSLMHTLGFANKQATIILIGLDNAGKTTLQYKLKSGSLQQFLPTQRAKEETLQVEGVTIKAWDLGGHQAARQLWTKYAAMADGIIFMCDASDADRIPEAAQELRALLSCVEVSEVPVAVFANKSELKHALPLASLQSGLRLSELTHPRLQLFPCSVVAGTGYLEGFRWIASFVQ